MEIETSSSSSSLLNTPNLNRSFDKAVNLLTSSGASSSSSNTGSYDIFNDGTHIWYGSGGSTGTSSTATERARIDSSGTITTPNNIGAGLNIGYKKIVTLSGTYAANTWYNTGIDRTTDTGIYLLNAWVDTYGAGGASYQETYIGWFILPNRGSNSGVTDAITIHRAGHAPNTEVVQFRTLRTPGSDSNIYLQWLSNAAYTTALNGTAGRNIQISIHRFATALNNG